MPARRHVLTLSLVLASLLTASAFATEAPVPAASRVESPAASGSPADGFLADLSCAPDGSVELSPAPLPMVPFFYPLHCGVCSEPECVGLTRGESCGDNPDYVCGASGICSADRLSNCTCGLLNPI